MDAKKWASNNCLLSDKKSLIRQSFNFCFQNKWFFWFRNLECRGPRVGSLCVEKHVHYLCRTFLFFLIHTIYLQKPQSFTQLHRAQSFISIYNMYMFPIEGKDAMNPAEWTPCHAFVWICGLTNQNLSTIYLQGKTEMFTAL